MNPKPLSNLFLPLALAVCAVVSSCSGARVREPPPLPVLRISLDKAGQEQLQKAVVRAMSKAPDPLPVVHIEGTLRTLDSYQRAMQSRHDWALIRDLATQYAISREQRYLDRYALYLSSWLDVYRISGNPIDETALGEWMLAYRMAGGALSPSVRSRMRTFACDLAERYSRQPPPHRKTSTNNWQSHRVKLAVMGALVCGDSGLIEKGLALFRQQVEKNLLPTGESVDFFERDALYYVNFSLEPLLETSLFSSLHGISLYHHTGSGGQSIGRSLAWLMPYARGERTHEEFVHSTVRFDAERDAAGIPGFSGLFDPKRTQYVYWLASRLDNRWTETSVSIGSPRVSLRAPWLAR